MKEGIIKSYLVSIFILVITQCIQAQNVDFENLVQGKALKVSGAIAANSIFYNSNQNSARAPFTYFLQGSINVSMYQFSMPISYSFSNQGEQFNYQVPFDFNRLSLHPKYKWIQAHIGDVNMTFSPYTLAGHQFTGGGIELSPKGAFKISAMAGELLRATEDDGTNETIPAFSRFGYGLKLGFEKEKYNLSLIGFYAKDDINSITTIPEEKGVIPQENLVLSLGGSVNVSKSFNINAEYSSSAITQDLRAEESGISQGLAGLFFNSRSSTEFYKAFNAGFDYKIDKSTVGITYERIDPGYETLGAYFFNSDFENITLDFGTSLFKDKLSLSFNVGYQRDDLDDQKEQATNRTVGSVNATFSVSDKTTITGSYSNFTTFTNARVNQFDVINDDNLVDNVNDALDYKQLSQNANVNINHILSKKETLQQTINLNYALADVYNEQDGIVRIGDASTFHNVNSSYTLGFPKKNMNLTAAINGTLNTIGTEDAVTWGPTVSVNKKFFDKKLNTSFATSYNQSKNTTATSNVTNFRANASYLYKEKHNFNLTAIQLFRGGSNQISASELTVTFGYNYSFTIGAPKFRKRKKATPVKTAKKKKEAAKNIVKDETELAMEEAATSKEFEFTYKEHVFRGSHDEVSDQIIALSKSSTFEQLKIKSVTDNLSLLAENMRANEGDKDKEYKKGAVHYLNYLYKHKDFIAKYHELAYKSLKQLYLDATKLDFAVEKQYLDLLIQVNEKQKKQEFISNEDISNLKLRKKKYKAHRWMESQLESLTEEDVLEDKGILKEFREKYISKVFLLVDNGKKNAEVGNYLLVKFAAFYHNKSNEIKK